MWVFCPDGRFSAIQDRDNPRRVIVRSRDREHLPECLQPPRTRRIRAER